MTFGENLKWLREERELTQAQLAEKAGLSKGAIGNFESGRRTNISFESMCKLADALGVEPEELGLKRRYDLERKLQVVTEKEDTDYRIDDIMKAFYLLNEDGKTEAAKRIWELTEVGRYRRKG